MIVQKKKKKKLQTNPNPLNPKAWSGGKEHKVTYWEGTGQGLHFNGGCCENFFLERLEARSSILIILYTGWWLSQGSVKRGAGRKGRREGNNFTAVTKPSLPGGEFRATSSCCHWLLKEQRLPKWGFLRLFVFLNWVSLTSEGFSTLGWKYKSKQCYNSIISVWCSDTQPATLWHVQSDIFPPLLCHLLFHLQSLWAPSGRYCVLFHVCAELGATGPSPCCYFCLLG